MFNIFNFFTDWLADNQPLFTFLILFLSAFILVVLAIKGDSIEEDTKEIKKEVKRII